MLLVDRVTAHRRDLTPAEIRVAEFMTDNPHSVGHLSALKLADASATSDATVVRTVRKLGFDGLEDLREQLATELSRAGRTGSSLRVLTGTRDSDPGRHLTEVASAVTDLPSRLPGTALTTAVDILGRAGRIHVIGFWPARAVADYAAARFRRVGVDARSVGATGRDFADDLVDLATGDAVVLLSYDRTTPEVHVLYDRAEELGVPVVQLSEEIHTVDHRCAAILGVGRGNPAFSPSYAPTVVVLEALVLAVAATDTDRSTTAGDLLDSLRKDLS